MGSGHLLDLHSGHWNSSSSFPSAPHPNASLVFLGHVFHSTDVEIEAQRGQITCSSSLSQEEEGKNLNPGAPVSRAKL